MVLIIRGSLGFSFLPTPFFLFLHSLLQYARWMWSSSPCPPSSPLQALPCPAFSSLPATYWVCKGRDCQPGQDEERNRRHHTAKCPKLFVTRMTGDPNHAAPIPDLGLGPQWALVQKGLSASKLWKKFSVFILSRLILGKVSRKNPLAVVEWLSLEIFKSHLVVVG